MPRRQKPQENKYDCYDIPEKLKRELRKEDKVKAEYTPSQIEYYQQTPDSQTFKQKAGKVYKQLKMQWWANKVLSESNQ